MGSVGGSMEVEERGEVGWLQPERLAAAALNIDPILVFGFAVPP